MKRLLTNITLLAAATVMSAAQAVPFVLGDIFASVGNGQVQQYSSAGVLKGTLNTGQGGLTTGSAFDSAGNFYVTNFSVGSVSKFNGPNDPHTTSIFAPAAGAAPESILFDAAHNVYVGSVDGDNDVRKFSASGVLLSQYNVATENRGSDWIDLATDQTTLFYTSEGRLIKRFNVGTATQLANFATLPGSGTAYALRLLAAGGLLVADTNDIKRLDASGNVIQTYDDPGNNGWFALNLDPDGTSFWSGDFSTGELLKFNIATGAVEQTISTGSGSLFGLSVFGEITQGGGGGVPEPASLALLSIGLAGLGIMRRRKA